MTGQFVDLETCAKVHGAPGTTQLRVGQPDSHKGMQGATCCPPRRRTPAAVSVPAEKERARNWEERKQQTNWAKSCPTHGSETSPNRTHNNTQGNHEVRALQQPPNAVHAERAISKHPPPPSTRCPRTPQGRELRPARREVPATGVATGPSYGDVKSLYGRAGGWDRRGCATGAPRSANRQGEEQHRHTECGSHTRRDKGEHSKPGGGAQQGSEATWASRTQKHSEAGYGRPVDRGAWTAKNSQTTPPTTSTSSIRQLLGAADTQTAHHATFSTALTHQLLGSANTETTPARPPAAVADRKQQPDATCEGKNG